MPIHNPFHHLFHGHRPNDDLHQFYLHSLTFLKTDENLENHTDGTIGLA
jgi:hypothetical protein